MEIRHEVFVLKERHKYEKMKENVKNVSKKQEKIRLNSVNSRTQKNNKVVINFITSDFDWLKSTILL